ncbi:MAG: hypothetical protein HQK77_12410 [Desulfobacterales bacterium]|nr:hypothetical protein [Desulfobacterales bacterium]
MKIYDFESYAAGFRLSSIEVYNWGTFNREIWQVSVDGKNSLLTGSNGSGKTTIVDILVTLLVPYNKRHYNMASGTAKKMDRNEEAYILGAYNSLRSEGEYSGKVQFLRSKENDYSIVLATFHNHALMEDITLAQVAFFYNGLKKTHIISTSKLSIMDLQQRVHEIDFANEWKKRLKKYNDIEVFDSFKHYSQKFSKIFGLKSEKALVLFSQLIGIKEIDNLNKFIRSNMLEASDEEDRFQRLRDNFKHLMDIYNLIKEAKARLEVLEPVMLYGLQYDETNHFYENLKTIRKRIDPFFAKKECELLRDAMIQETEALQQVKRDIEAIREEIDQLRKTKEDIDYIIRTNEKGQRIHEISMQIERDQKILREKLSWLNEYNAFAIKMERRPDPDEAEFYQTLKQMKSQITLLDEKERQLRSHISKTESELTIKEKELTLLQKDIKSLKNRQNNIPESYIEIRRSIASALGIGESLIPFVGELIRIKHDEKLWEKSIEYLLRDFGLSLLVREDRFSGFIQVILKQSYSTPITFFKILDEHAQTPNQVISLAGHVSFERTLLSKIDLHPKTPYQEWLRNYLNTHYRITLVDQPEECLGYDHAMAPNGLIKRHDAFEKSAHQKVSESDFILGWDNQEKIILKEKKAYELMQAIQSLRTTLEDLEQEFNILKDEHDMMVIFTNRFTDYKDIDVQSIEAKVEAAHQELSMLQQDSRDIHEFSDQLELVEKRITKKEKQKDEYQGKTGRIEHKIKVWAEKIQRHSDALEKEGLLHTDEGFELLIPYIADHLASITLTNLNDIKEYILIEVGNEWAKIVKARNQIESQLKAVMREYMRPGVDIRRRFPDWENETRELSDDISFLPMFRNVYETISKERLPEYEREFKKRLTKNVATDFSRFYEALKFRSDDIKQSIQEINDSLKEIDYNTNPSTYIQIEAMKENDERINEFNELVLDALHNIANIHTDDDEYLEVRFNKIKTVIDRLDLDFTWRQHVIDVRNWFKYAAEERERETNRQVHYYEASKSLSGGQQVKIAYTILASAITYQYNIQRSLPAKRVFRFVAIDEAFNNLSPDFSMYVLKLFKKLGLQFMVITPLDKVNLVQSFIDKVHFVRILNNAESEVYNIEKDTYFLEKKTFHELKAV